MILTTFSALLMGFITVGATTAPASTDATALTPYQISGTGQTCATSAGTDPQLLNIIGVDSGSPCMNFDLAKDATAAFSVDLTNITVNDQDEFQFHLVNVDELNSYGNGVELDIGVALVNPATAGQNGKLYATLDANGIITSIEIEAPGTGYQHHAVIRKPNAGGAGSAVAYALVEDGAIIGTVIVSNHEPIIVPTQAAKTFSSNMFTYKDLPVAPSNVYEYKEAITAGTCNAKCGTADYADESLCDCKEHSAVVGVTRAQLEYCGQGKPTYDPTTSKWGFSVTVDRATSFAVFVVYKPYYKTTLGDDNTTPLYVELGGASKTFDFPYAGGTTNIAPFVSVRNSAGKTHKRIKVSFKPDGNTLNWGCTTDSADPNCKGALNHVADANIFGDMVMPFSSRHFVTVAPPDPMELEHTVVLPSADNTAIWPKDPTCKVYSDGATKHTDQYTFEQAATDIKPTFNIRLGGKGYPAGTKAKLFKVGGSSSGVMPDASETLTYVEDLIVVVSDGVITSISLDPNRNTGNTFLPSNTYRVALDYIDQLPDPTIEVIDGGNVDINNLDSAKYVFDVANKVVTGITWINTQVATDMFYSADNFQLLATSFYTNTQSTDKKIAKYRVQHLEPVTSPAHIDVEMVDDDHNDLSNSNWFPCTVVLESKVGCDKQKIKSITINALGYFLEGTTPEVLVEQGSGGSALSATYKITVADWARAEAKLAVAPNGLSAAVTITSAGKGYKNAPKVTIQTPDKDTFYHKKENGVSKAFGAPFSLLKSLVVKNGGKGYPPTATYGPLPICCKEGSDNSWLSPNGVPYGTAQVNAGGTITAVTLSEDLGMFGGYSAVDKTKLTVCAEYVPCPGNPVKSISFKDTDADTCGIPFDTAVIGVSVPEVFITEGGNKKYSLSNGRGATATATAVDGKMTAITLTAKGHGYTSSASCDVRDVPGVTCTAVLHPDPTSTASFGAVWDGRNDLKKEIMINGAATIANGIVTGITAKSEFDGQDTVYLAAQTGGSFSTTAKSSATYTVPKLADGSPNWSAMKTAATRKDTAYTGGSLDFKIFGKSHKGTSAVDLVAKAFAAVPGKQNNVLHCFGGTSHNDFEVELASDGGITFVYHDVLCANNLVLSFDKIEDHLSTRSKKTFGAATKFNGVLDQVFAGLTVSVSAEEYPNIAEGMTLSMASILGDTDLYLTTDTDYENHAINVETLFRHRFMKDYYTNPVYRVCPNVTGGWGLIDVTYALTAGTGTVEVVSWASTDFKANTDPVGASIGKTGSYVFSEISGYDECRDVMFSGGAADTCSSKASTIGITIAVSTNVSVATFGKGCENNKECRKNPLLNSGGVSVSANNDGSRFTSCLGHPSKTGGQCYECQHNFDCNPGQYCFLADNIALTASDLYELMNSKENKTLALALKLTNMQGTCQEKKGLGKACSAHTSNILLADKDIAIEHDDDQKDSVTYHDGVSCGDVYGSDLTTALPNRKTHIRGKDRAWDGFCINKVCAECVDKPLASSHASPSTTSDDQWICSGGRYTRVYYTRGGDSVATQAAQAAESNKLQLEQSSKLTDVGASVSTMDENVHGDTSALNSAFGAIIFFILILVIVAIVALMIMTGRGDRCMKSGSSSSVKKVKSNAQVTPAAAGANLI